MEARQPGLSVSARYSEVLAQLKSSVGPVLSLERLMQVLPGADPDVLKEMMARCVPSGSFTEFARVFVDTEELMTTRSSELQHEVSDCHSGLAEAQRQLSSSQLTEVRNPNSIMEGSVLTVEVHSIRLERDHRSSMTVELTCENRVIKTKAVIVTRTATWDEAFTFPISHGKGDLVVSVVESLPSGKNTVGQIAIPVKLLNDQLKHQSKFELVGGEKAEIQLSLQWVWSKVEYFRSLQTQWSDNLKASQDELHHIQRQLSILTSFASPQDQFPFQTIDSAVTEKVEQLIQATGVGANVAAAVKICTICLLICTMLEVIARPDFPNVVISAGAFYIYAAGSRVKKVNLKWFCMALFFSEVFDLLYYTLCLSVPVTQALPFSDQADVQLQRLSAALSFVNTLSKACAFVVFWKQAAVSP